MEYSIRTILPTCILLSMGFANPVNASIVNNLGGINYEWLEFNNTINMSRVSVEAMLTDSNSALYGYRYATRQETQSLLESYMPYVPSVYNDWHAYLAPAAQAFLDDFGVTLYDNFDATYQTVTNDGVLIDYNMYITSYFYHGSTDECGVDYSCVGRMLTAALDGDIQAQFNPARRGFDATWPDPDRITIYDNSPIAASLLVRELITVPLPAAFWLFGSGAFMLLGFTGLKNKAGNTIHV